MINKPKGDLLTPKKEVIKPEQLTKIIKKVYLLKSKKQYSNFGTHSRTKRKLALYRGGTYLKTNNIDFKQFVYVYALFYSQFPELSLLSRHVNIFTGTHAYNAAVDGEATSVKD